MTTTPSGALARSPLQARGVPSSQAQPGPGSGGAARGSAHAEAVMALPGQLEPWPLRAYLATALTGLADDARRHVSKVSDIAAATCSELGISLYEPRNVTDPVHHPSVPDQEVFRLDRQQVTRSDLLIYLADYPSTGAGQELVFAYEALIPIIVVAGAKTRVSRMVTGIPGATFEVRYEQFGDLRRRLSDRLSSVLPFLLQRRTRLKQHERHRVGERIREARISQGLSHDDLAERLGRDFFTASQIAQWEESNDLESNVRLIHLREIANALDVDVKTLFA